MVDILQPVESGIQPVREKPENTSTLGVKYYPLELPSMGKLGYPREVEYRDILVRDEKILATATEQNYFSVLHRILKSLLKDQSFFNTITIHDRDFLLVWMWANNYSSEKIVPIECAVCGHKTEKTINLTKLKVDEIAEDLDVPMVMELSDGKRASLSLLTVGMQETATAYVKNHPDVDFETAALALSIQIEGVKFPPEAHIRWVEENIKGKDFALVRAFHEHFAYGIDDKVEFYCPACHEVTHPRVPFQPSWLRPTVQTDFEKMLQSHKSSKNQSD